MIELDLAELARERHAYAEAEGRYGRVLASLPADAAPRMVALRGRAEVRYRSGQAQGAVEDFRAAREVAQRLKDAEAEVEIVLSLATALDWSNDAPAATALLEEAQKLADERGVSARTTRALLLAARGRALFRAGRWGEACTVLDEALEASELLGAAGAEPLLQSLVLLEVVLPFAGRMLEAARVAERALQLSKARGDYLNLASALNNRRNLMVARKDLPGALADQRAFMEIGRQLGVALAEYAGEFNLAELLYFSGDVQAALPHVQRALAFEAERPDVAPRPSALLLLARLQAFSGQLDEARETLARVRAASQAARAAGRLTPSEEVLAGMVELSTSNATEEQWEELISLSDRDSLEQEPVEVLELRALSALRAGKADSGRRYFAYAAAMAARVPNVMDDRLEAGRKLASAPAAGQTSVA